jgi:hypothetical protein
MGQQRAQSIRLVIEYEGTRLTLASQRRVAMVAPVPQRLVARPDERGYCVELRDESGQPLYRHALHDPMKESLEVPAGDGTTLVRQPRTKVAGRFSIVVPDLSEARKVAVLGPTGKVAAAGSLVREIASFDLARQSGEQ